MKVAVIQLNSTANKEKNLQKAVRFIDDAIQKKARLIALPEAFLYRGPLNRTEEREYAAETLDGPAMAFLKEKARWNKVFILAGSFYEKKNGCRKVYNTAALINEKGIVQAVYRKRHLFSAKVEKFSINEEKQILPGKSRCLTPLKEFSLGIFICFDVRFPEDFRFLSHKGVEVFALPSAFTYHTGKAHWKVLVQARAIENLAYVIAPNQIGKDAQGFPSYGHSLIVDPWGKVLAEASGNKEEVIFAEIKKEKVVQRRRMLRGVFNF